MTSWRRSIIGRLEEFSGPKLASWSPALRQQAHLHTRWAPSMIQKASWPPRLHFQLLLPVVRLHIFKCRDWCRAHHYSSSPISQSTRPSIPIGVPVSETCSATQSTGSFVPSKSAHIVAAPWGPNSLLVPNQTDTPHPTPPPPSAPLAPTSTDPAADTHARCCLSN